MVKLSTIYFTSQTPISREFSGDLISQLKQCLQESSKYYSLTADSVCSVFPILRFNMLLLKTDHVSCTTFIGAALATVFPNDEMLCSSPTAAPLAKRTDKKPPRISPARQWCCSWDQTTKLKVQTNEKRHLREEGHARTKC